MNIIKAILISVSMFVIGIVSGAFIREPIFVTLFTIILPAFATLIAAYLGAKYAFELHEKKQEKELINKNFIAGNRAIFSLVMKYNKLTNIEAQLLKPHEGNPKAFLEMTPMLNLAKNEINVDVNSISFLLDTDHRNLLAEVCVALSKYDSSLDAINARSNLLLDEVLPALDKACIRENENYTHEDIEKAMGHKNYVILTQSTQQIFDNVKETIQFFEQIINKLTETLKELFPGRKVLYLGHKEE